MDKLESLDIRYVAGLIDADGSFALTLDTRNTSENTLFVPRWVVNFRAIHEDIVRSTHEKMGVGRVYFSRRLAEDRPGIWSWQTLRLQDTLDVCVRLERHLHIKRDVCRLFIDSIRMWKSYPKGGRPRSAYESILNLWTSVNDCRQTQTARLNKSEKVIHLQDAMRRMA